LPLDPGLVADFHTSVLNGDVNEVNRQLSVTPRLGNSQDTLGFTPLMNVVRSGVSSGQTQVKLIDSLMQKGGAALATRSPNRSHILLMACRMGCHPDVIDCILRWNSKRQKTLDWNHCDEDNDGPLVVAARSGSLALVSHLLSLSESDTTDCYGEDSNSPLKVVNAAIKSGNEKLVLLVLRHERFKDKIEDIEVYDSDSYSDDEYDFSFRTATSITVDDCVREAYNRKMFDAVCEFESLDNWMIPVQIWLCWRKSQTELKEVQRKADEASSIVQTPANAQINAIAKKCQEDLVHKHNPMLLPLLLARSRYTTDPSNISSDDPLFQFLLECEDDAFRSIAQYSFILGPDKLQKEVEGRVYFKKYAEWCSECEGWFLPWSCVCYRYTGYSS